jgi:hypothetical protein
MEPEGSLPGSEETVTGPHLSQMIPVHILFLQDHYSNINLYNSQEVSYLRNFLLKFCIFFYILHVCYISQSSRPPLFDHPNNISRRVQIMKLHIM